MSIITVRLNKEKEKIYNKYAKFNNVALSTLIKEALMEKIENEIDIKSVLEYEKKLTNNDVEFYTLEETKNMLDL